jgi:NAD(P)-dependent dehydrogenase (short-subunit alcohol dehydrogenase family)
MKIDLKDKVVLVTGASRGIGRAIAIAFAESGAKVAIHYHRNHEAAEAVATKAGVRSKLFQADLAKPLDVLTLFHDVTMKLGRLDVLVNNAGIAIMSPVASDDLQWVEDWTSTMMVNLNATGLLCKKAIEYFVTTRQNGIIINISSRAAFRGDTADYMAYAASKAGILALTKTIAKAYGKKGIKAYAIAPGFVKTDMAEDFIREYGSEHALGDLALQELTKPEDLAPLIVFLGSGLAAHATGTTIDVNAGSYMH